MVNLSVEEFKVVVERDPDTQQVLTVEWCNAEGEEHNTMGPAVIWYDKDTGIPVLKLWRRNGRPFRPPGLGGSEGGTDEEFDKETGHLIRAIFKNTDSEPRAGGPFQIFFDRNTGKKIYGIYVTGEKEYYDGRLPDSENDLTL